jgi:hypothetical protein
MYREVTMIEVREVLRLRGDVPAVCRPGQTVDGPAPIETVAALITGDSNVQKACAVIAHG